MEGIRCSPLHDPQCCHVHLLHLCQRRTMAWKTNQRFRGFYCGMKNRSILDVPLIQVSPTFENRFTRSGKPWRKRRPKTFEEKVCDFWANVVKGQPNECWQWSGPCLTGGYGEFGIGKTCLLAHRVAWELANGKIPHGSDVLHHCDHPACVNPNHLFLGDQALNNADKCDKGRQARNRGEKGGGAKLTWKAASEIREAWSNGARQRDLAAHYGVSDAAVWLVVHNKTWNTL